VRSRRLSVRTALTVWYLAVRFPRFWRHWSWDLLRAQLAYALPLGAAGLLAIAQEDLHNYIVSHRFDAATYAIYAVGCMQIPLLLVFRDSVGSVMIARVSALRQEGARTGERGSVSSGRKGTPFEPLEPGNLRSCRQISQPGPRLAIQRFGNPAAGIRL